MFRLEHEFGVTEALFSKSLVQAAENGFLRQTMDNVSQVCEYAVTTEIGLSVQKK